MIHEFLNEAAEQPHYDFQSPEQVLEILQGLEDISSLSMRDCFHARAYLNNYVLWHAEQENHYTQIPYRLPDGTTAVSTVVDESKYPEQIVQLHRLQNVIKFSPQTKQWLELGRESLVSSWGGKIQDIAESWKTMSMPQREQIIRDFARDQVEHYGRILGAEFKTPKFNFVPDHPAPAVMELASDFNPDTSGADNMFITFNRKKLLGDDSFADAIEFAHHEIIHHLLIQLGFLARDDHMDYGHPLYGDAMMKVDRMEFGHGVPVLIQSVYNMDDEENIAYDQQFKLSRELFHNRSMTAKIAKYAENIFASLG